MSYDDGHCDLCGQEAYCHTKYYGSAPFIDGKYYNFLCWVCFNVPINNTDQLHTIKEMREDGFGETESKISYAALTKSMTKKPSFTDIFDDIPIQAGL